MKYTSLIAHAKTYKAAHAGGGEMTPRAYGGGMAPAPAVNAYFDGDKFLGGFGPTQLFTADYWTLRERSSQLFTDNLYARGLIRRLVTNEINTGLTPESAPDEALVGQTVDALNVWTESTETRWSIWGKHAEQCDFKHAMTFGALQRMARLEALVAGDVLVVLRINPATRLPMVQLIKGAKVRSPLSDDGRIARGNYVVHGVEHNVAGRVVAYWIVQDDNTLRRIPAKAPRSGRLMAWLVFGTDKRLDDVRGQPLLSLVLQSLKEIDRYRDSTQRKAVINSMVAMFIKKTEDKPGTRPVTAAAMRRGSAVVADADGPPRQFNTAAAIPGVVMEELQQGEEPVFIRSTTSLNL